MIQQVKTIYQKTLQNLPYNKLNRYSIFFFNISQKNKSSSVCFVHKTISIRFCSYHEDRAEQSKAAIQLLQQHCPVTGVDVSRIILALNSSSRESCPKWSKYFTPKYHYHGLLYINMFLPLIGLTHLNFSNILPFSTNHSFIVITVNLYIQHIYMLYFYVLT